MGGGAGAMALCILYRVRGGGGGCSPPTVLFLGHGLRLQRFASPNKNAALEKSRECGVA